MFLRKESRMNRKIFTAGIFVCLSVLTGCIGSSSETRFFTLGGNGNEQSLPCRVTVLRFRNLSGADRRFLYRSQHNRMQSDEFNRWLLDPELLLERLLRGKLSGTGNDEVRVRCVITDFEIDTVRNAAVLAGDFTLHCGEHLLTCHIKEECKFSAESGDSAAAAAEAMDQCASALAGKLRKKILELYKQSQTKNVRL